MTAPRIIRVIPIAEVTKVIRITRPVPQECPECHAPKPDHLTGCAKSARVQGDAA